MQCPKFRSSYPLQELAASHEANAKQKALSDRQLVELKLRFDEQLEQMVKDSEKRWEDVKVANATRVTDLARELDLTRADLVSSEATALSLKAQLQSAQEAEVLAQDRASVVAQDHSRLREGWCCIAHIAVIIVEVCLFSELANAEKKYAAILQELLATKALVRLYTSLRARDIVVDCAVQPFVCRWWIHGRSWVL